MYTFQIFLALLITCQAQVYHWQPTQNISNNLYDNITPDMTSAEHNGTQVIIWSHAATLRQAVSFDHGLTWNTRMLSVINEPTSLFGAFHEPHLQYANGEWILIFTSTDIPYQSLTITAKANALFGSWEYLDHQERDFDAASWNEITEVDNSLTFAEDYWLASWLENNTLKVQHNWTTITDCASGVLRQELINGWLIIYQTVDGVYVANASDCASPQEITSISSDFIVQDNMLILKSGEVYLSLNGVIWIQQASVQPGAYIMSTWFDQYRMVLAPNYTCMTNNNGADWNCQEDNTSAGGTLINQTLFWMQPPYLQSAQRVEYTPTPIPTKVNQTAILIIQDNQIIESDLQMDGALILSNQTLKINGDLILNHTSQLTLQEGTIDVNGTLWANGQLNITDVQDNTTIMTYNDHQGNFTQVHKRECQHLEYAQSYLMVSFTGGCDQEDAITDELDTLQIWQIATIAGGSSLAVVGAGVSLVYFRKRLFPYRDRPYEDESYNN